MKDSERITSTVKFNQRHEHTVSDARRFVEMILEETPMFAEAAFESQYDGETATFQISMNAGYMDDFNTVMRLLVGDRDENGILHYLGMGLTEARSRAV